MTIEILSRDDCLLEDVLVLAENLRRLPGDELPGMAREDLVQSIQNRLGDELADGRCHFWIGREGEDVTGLAVLKPLEWDSEILGVSCASLDLRLAHCERPSRQATSSLLIHQALTRCRLEDIRFLSAKVGSDEFARIHALEDAGFRLMDTEMVMRSFQGPTGFAPPEGVTFVLKREEEVEGLGDMGRLFTMSRFFSDPRIGEERARKLWQASVRDSCRGHADGFLLAERKGEPLAFVTFMDQELRSRSRTVKTRSFFHVGVAEKAQGQGLGSALIQEAVRLSESCDHVLVETQSRNASALALYQKCGFRIVDSRFAFHLWLA